MQLRFRTGFGQSVKIAELHKGVGGRPGKGGLEFRFSLEDSGEKYGMESEEYKCALGRYNELRAAVRGDSIEALRRFCTRYSQDELSFRRKNALISHGLSDSDLEDYLAGKAVQGLLSALTAAALAGYVL